VEAKNSLEEERKEMADKLEAIAHFESQIAEISQWYMAADAVYRLNNYYIYSSSCFKWSIFCAYHILGGVPRLSNNHK